jgi:RNA-binding protein YlmH
VLFILNNLEKVASNRIQVAEIEPEQLNLPNVKEKEIRSTVASLRLDAIAALGFGESRTKMVREIKAERVKVNWKPVKNPDQTVNSGDIISMRGRGRVIFREITGTSKKGRLGVVLVRLL